MRRGDACARSRDAGLATVWAAGAIAALCTVAVLVCWLGAAALARHRAAGAADLAALAAAGRAGQGTDLACAGANWVTGRMNVRLVTCRLVGLDALVEVESALPGALARFGSAAAHARAGPADRAP
jgi:secretion/DNA translocation related TadE-like protein